MLWRRSCERRAPPRDHLVLRAAARYSRTSGRVGTIKAVTGYLNTASRTEERGSTRVFAGHVSHSVGFAGVGGAIAMAWTRAVSQHATPFHHTYGQACVSAGHRIFETCLPTNSVCQCGCDNLLTHHFNSVNLSDGWTRIVFPANGLHDLICRMRFASGLLSVLEDR